ncbi:MAG: efflux RND transporter periplasmic adaptor subunit [bacterium]|nr:efflux RND transporter periplasmic adaptor subunit [bacterium]
MSKFLSKFWVITVVIAAILAGLYFYFGKNKNEPPANFVTAGIKNLVQEVSVTGRVKPASSVDLAFEKSGRVTYVGAKIGDRVAAGQTLLKLDDSELQAQLAKVKADLGAQNLDNIKRKAEADLANVYEGAISAALETLVVAKNSLFILTDIQYAHFSSNDQDGTNIASAKEIAILAFLGQNGGGRWNNESISSASGGTFGMAQSAASSRTSQDIDLALASLLDALGKIKNTLNAVPAGATLTSTEKTNLNTEKNNIAAEITVIAGKIQAINVQKVTNDNNIYAVSSAIKSAEANVQNIEAQIAKTELSSPISGVVSKENAKVGEIVQGNTIIVSVISNLHFQIEADVPEADIAKIKIGNLAKVTLDAYGGGVLFEAKIVSVDPAERIIDGVATYKVTFQFSKEDARIKSGMTANIDIAAAKKDGVLTVPARTIFTKNAKKYVTIYLGENNTEEREVETGLTGSDGNVEITSGLTEGEKILIPKIE